MIFNMTGGANPLNFKVVGNPKPSNPKENTIWIDTDIPIPFYVMCPPVPVPMPYVEEGCVLIETGNSLTTAFNALKKNAIVVCPTVAKQYVNGALVNKSAEVHLNGEWIDLKTFLIEDGSDNTTLTGGWSDCYWGNAQTHQRTTPVITWSGNALIMDINQSSMSEWYGYYCYHWGYAHNNAIDLTDVKRIELIADSSAYGGSYPEDDGGHAWTRLVVGKSRDSSPVASADIASRGTVTNKTVTLDVSNLTGMYYIGFYASFYCANSKALKVTAYNIELKR